LGETILFFKRSNTDTMLVFSKVDTCPTLVWTSQINQTLEHLLTQEKINGDTIHIIHTCSLKCAQCKHIHLLYSHKSKTKKIIFKVHNPNNMYD
jgi:hypothetical protein